MSEELNFKFELKDTNPPEVVIRQVFEEIAVVTNGYVFVELAEYLNPITAYVRKNSLNVMTEMFSEKTIDIQSDLGEIKAERHRYEVYLKSKVMENYKYRLFFVNYETMAYPVEIVVDEKLAEGAFNQTRTVFVKDNMTALEEMLEKIKYSDFFKRLIQNIINESIRRENK